VGALALGLNALLLGGVCLGLVREVARASDAVRVRNALLLRRARPGDFQWTPERLPRDFRVETTPPATWLTAILEQIGVTGQPGAWEKALCIAAHLSERQRGKGGIRADLVTTYTRIREGYGYCADFARVFLAFAHAAGLFARQWAFSFDGFGGHGHVFVEIYDPGRGQWVFLDVYNNFHVLDRHDRRPLSALELRQALTGGDAYPLVAANGPGPRGFPREERLWDYYRRGLPEWYLWWGNATLPHDERRRTPLARTRTRTAYHALLALLGRTAPIRVYETSANRAQVERLGTLRRRVVAGAALCALLSVALLYQILTLGLQTSASHAASIRSSGDVLPGAAHRAPQREAR
jgi:hypothetical protein